MATIVFNGDITSGSAVIANVDDTSALVVGMEVNAFGIPNGSKILSKRRDFSVTLDTNATQTLANQDFVIGQAKLASCSAFSSADILDLDIKIVSILFAKVSGFSSADAISLSLVPVTVRSAKCSGFTTAVVEDLRLKGVNVWFAKISAFTGALVSINIIGGSDTDGMTVNDMIDDLVNLCGYRSQCMAPPGVVARALTDLNAAMQTVWNRANERDYWSLQQITATLTNGQSSYPLPDDIQNVVGPCRRADTKTVLAIAGTQAELDSFIDLYLDGETPTEPVAYHILRQNQTGTDADPAKCTLLIAPGVVGASLTFLLDVVKEAPRYTIYDLTDGPVIPIPHAYTETLLLPIARYNISSSERFDKESARESINRDYQFAAKALGLADPLPGKAGDNQPRRKEDAA